MDAAQSRIRRGDPVVGSDNPNGHCDLRLTVE